MPVPPVRLRPRFARNKRFADLRPASRHKRLFLRPSPPAGEKGRGFPSQNPHQSAAPVASPVPLPGAGASTADGPPLRTRHRPSRNNRMNRNQGFMPTRGEGRLEPRRCSSAQPPVRPKQQNEQHNEPERRKPTVNGSPCSQEMAVARRGISKITRPAQQTPARR